MLQPTAFLHGVWALASSDRGLAIVAIVVGLGGVLRGDWLFHKLYKREKQRREVQLREANTVVQSYAAFSRALQGVRLSEKQLTKNAAFALLSSFRLQQLLYPHYTPD